MKRSFLFFFTFCFNIISFYSVNAQSNSIPKNIVFARYDYHFQVRDNYGPYENSEFSIGYDRKLFHFGMNNVFAGLRTGLYYETALTGGYFDQTYHHPFVGFYPSYVLAPTNWLGIQLAGSWDIIFETHESIEDFWWWSFGFEPSVQFYPVKGLFISTGLGIGTFPYYNDSMTYTRFFMKAGFTF